MQASQSSSKHRCFAISLFPLLTEFGRDKEKQLPRAPAVTRMPEPHYCGIQCVQLFPNERVLEQPQRGCSGGECCALAAGFTLLGTLQSNQRLLAVLPLQGKSS